MPSEPKTKPPQFAVVDVETTGFGSKDRVVEIAIVVLDENLNVVDEYDTLIDPMRDVGPVHVHGITPTMLANAPVFEEVATAVCSRIHNRVIVAHNLSFDQRMIRNEYLRLSAELLPGKGVCTLRQTGEKLNLACHTYGITLGNHHRALADARATAQLLQRAFDDMPVSLAARIESLTLPLNTRTLRREASGGDKGFALERIISSARYPTSDGAMLSYLDALDWVLDDLIVTESERDHLLDIIDELELSTAAITEAHNRYLDSIIQAAWRDGVITPEENRIITRVAEILNVVDFEIPEVTGMPTAPKSISLGSRVCFTGTVVDKTGNKVSREELEAMAAKAGLQPVSSVTKKNCDLLVASDTSSGSGKAGKARKFKIPIMSANEFLDEFGSAG